MSTTFDEINLLFGEKISLLSMRIHKRKTEDKIKFFDSLFYEYHFIKKNYSDERDSFNALIPDGTYSLSMRYARYKVYRREKLLTSNLAAAIISGIVSIFFSVITSLITTWLIMKLKL